MSDKLFRLDFMSYGIRRNYAVNLSWDEAVMMANSVQNFGYTDFIVEEVIIKPQMAGYISTLEINRLLPPSPRCEDDNEWQALARAGSKIPAIKKCRDMAPKKWYNPLEGCGEGYYVSSLGLKEAKNKVEAFLASIAC